MSLTVRAFAKHACGSRLIPWNPQDKKLSAQTDGGTADDGGTPTFYRLFVLLLCSSCLSAAAGEDEALAGPARCVLQQLPASVSQFVKETVGCFETKYHTSTYKGNTISRSEPWTGREGVEEKRALFSFRSL